MAISASTEAAAPTHDLTKCTTCSSIPPNLLQCVRCKAVSYCNKDCQKSNWKSHKPLCPLLASGATLEEAREALPLDPDVASRAQYTVRYLQAPVPENASPQWLKYFNGLMKLVRLLGEHEGMARNNTQTFNTPAFEKNNVYFAWDFVGRTLTFISRVPPTMQRMTREDREAWNDTKSRTALITDLILNRQKMIDMVDQPYQHLNTVHPEMGDEIIAAARALRMS
ncbi:hypothetical protein B0A48_16926 [Cryoendolithus antarcticus]|uniref:MYND-type domain-containing protein n=1 Tax=Cryoendolithus antarcticus TaxID=1507870 RepID=A0A1V8SCS5_9PEZI|nr:hypothetical protein B0A48_16926 [Cryoendolithus antarcticus]